ncbi:lasso RiPP family leader peptide-containing protein [Kitasatospora sp. NPDC048722]
MSKKRYETPVFESAGTFRAVTGWKGIFSWDFFHGQIM